MSGMSEAAKRGRRNWSLEDKWRIVEEAQLPGNSVAEVARRRGVNSNLLFRWIRAAEAGQLGHRPDSLVLLPQPALDFIPIGVFGRGDDEGPAMTIPVAPSAAAPPVASSARPKSVLPAKGPTLDERPGVIEIDLANGVRVRVDAFVNEKALRRVLAALGEAS
ncbi:IS66-like element accessory protein TnpA [Sinorhizobium meliloti]|uniref:IS66-like element accessory protein TnpA n=3 Tax=Rhizobium meliloti TaxID=382 RepID=UPI0009B759D0|nr:transposase [Sinorhizobium meliloti]MDE3831046.1 transposase [Sinorhizobium meliloti]MDE4579913.1 transposase [Sinorhizobium meliloti]MDW9545744.1 transposase [Sinorhizobium meliloti]MDW9777773.1 transposase [Sinorhizobium meliloti]MQV23531.1 transposase [Sinorhizobium meliloti]